MRTILALLVLVSVSASAQNWHLNTEPVYFFLASPNVALDRTVSPSLAIGFQYAALEWAEGGRNLSGFQAFISRTGEIERSSEVLKLYAGRLSPGATLLKIEANSGPKAVFEVLYGYRWVNERRLTVAVLAGAFFTSDRLYPAMSIPVGWMF
jgi:hypothetical protein